MKASQQNVKNLCNKFTKTSLIGLLLIFCGLSDISFGQTFVINGLPIARTTSTPVSSKRIELSNSQTNEFRLLIKKKGDKYFWTSRENKELFHIPSGAYSYFLNFEGSGYIKVFNYLLVPESIRGLITDKIGIPNGKFVYMEHIIDQLNTYTYWGIAESFSP